MAASAGLSLWLRMPGGELAPADSAPALADPEVQLAITGRSGPIVVEIEYRVPIDQARGFYGQMQEVQSVRQRNGAYGWALARDIGDPELWTERFHCPTWHDYLRHRDRPTAAEQHAFKRALGFHSSTDDIRIRRMLERPFGSVRWTDAAPDRGGIVGPFTLAGSGGGGG